jgi:hypothetical protein
MRGWLWFAALILAARPMAAQRLLPANFASWQAATTSAVPKAQTTPENAKLFQDCQQKSVEQQTYRRGGQSIRVTLRELGDPSYAYSAFSILRPRPATNFRPTSHSAIGTNEGMMLVRNLLVTINGRDLPAHARDFSALAASLKARASPAPYPTLWQFLPAQQMIPDSDRYALDARTFARALNEEGLSNLAKEKWVGFEADDAEAEIARYNVAGRGAALVLVSYPTNELAALHIKDMDRWFDVNAARKAKPEKPVLFARRMGSLVGLVYGTRDKAAAENLLGRIRYQTDVTWEVPGLDQLEHKTETTMAGYVIGSIFGTFAIAIAALVVGIALGMIRVGVKRFLPGLVFDRHRSVEILQLGLSSKPIDGRDFY